MNLILVFEFACLVGVVHVFSQSCTTLDEYMGQTVNLASFSCGYYECCSNATIVSTSIGECDAAKSCMNSDLTTQNLLRCHGYLSCAFAKRILAGSYACVYMYSMCHLVYGVTNNNIIDI